MCVRYLLPNSFKMDEKYSEQMLDPNACPNKCHGGFYYMYIPSTSLLASSAGLSLFLPMPIPTCAYGSSSSSDQIGPFRTVTVRSSETERFVMIRLKSERGMNDSGNGRRTSVVGGYDSFEIDN